MFLATLTRAQKSASTDPSPRSRLRQVGAALAAAALVVGAMTLGLAAPAHAATVTGAITNVAVTPTTPKQGGQLTTDIDWKVPDGTQSGDTFQLTLSSALTNLPSDFALRDPATNAVVANAVLSQTDPAVITFTLTDYASTHYATHGTAYVTSTFSATAAPSGVPTPITSTTGDGSSFTTVITSTGVVGNRAAPVKYGTFASSDQGRTQPADFLVYRIDSPVGPFDTVSVSDAVPIGQRWLYDCSTFRTFFETIGANNAVTSAVPATPTSSSCTTGDVSAAFGAADATHMYVIRVAVSLPTATGSTGAPQTFLNHANVSTTTVGVTTSQVAYASNIQSSDGGAGAGSNPVAGVSIAKGDSKGNAADTAATAATLPANGTATLEYVVTNSGTDPLTNVQVTDQLLANGTVTGLTCDFSALGGPSSGTAFSGHFAVGSTFDCTAQLSGVTTAGGDHHDVGTVTATGVNSGSAVTASNDYFAVVTSQPAGAGTNAGGTTPPAGGTGGGTPGTGTGDGTGATPGSGSVAPAATGSTPVTSTTLAYTGTDVVGPLGVAGGLFGLGIALTVLAGIRRRRIAADAGE